MGYYADLFLRPKQAVLFALQSPSMVRAIGFILLGTLAGVLASLLFTGSILFDTIFGFLLSDVLRWLISGVVLVLVGMFFKKIPFNTINFSRALSTLAQLNVYGFFMFLILGIILPVLTIPNVLTATTDLQNGLIGEEEFVLAVEESIASASDTSLLAIPLILLAALMVLYGMYVLFLSIQKYLDVTVFKTILVWLLVVLVQSVFVFFSG